MSWLAERGCSRLGTHGESSWEGVVGCEMGGDVIVCPEITCLSLHGLQTMGLGPSTFPCWAQNKIYFSSSQK